MEERRLFARINVKLQLKFFNLDNGKNGEAETVDISANGVGFVTKENLEAKTPLDILLYIPHDGKPIRARGEIVWSQSLADGSQQRVGMRLEELELVSFSKIIEETHWK